jgi:hypothetical protein
MNNEEVYFIQTSEDGRTTIVYVYNKGVIEKITDEFYNKKGT